MTQTTSPAARPDDAAPAYRRRVRNYLLDSKLQLRFATYLVLAAAAITACLGVLLWKAYGETNTVIALADPMVSQALAQEDRRRMIWLAVGFGAVAVCLLTMALVVTHRVAGPALYLARTCRKVRDGDLTRPRPLRRRDLLVQLADEVFLMIEALREREEGERAALAAAAARLHRPGATVAEIESAEVLERLAAEKARRIGR